jgi:hypothetical protein
MPRTGYLSKVDTHRTRISPSRYRILVWEYIPTTFPESRRTVVLGSGISAPKDNAGTQKGFNRLHVCEQLWLL